MPSYLVSEPTARLLRSLSAPRGGVELVPRPVRLEGGASAPADPLPFDIRIIPGDPFDAILAYLPAPGTGYVLADGLPIPPAPGQPVGNSTSAWADIGTATRDAARYIYLARHTNPDTGDVDGWQILDRSAPWDGTPPARLLLAVYHIPPVAPSPSGQLGLVQCHHGTANLDAGAYWRTGGDVSTCHGTSIRIDSLATDANGAPLASVTISVSQGSS